MAYTLYHFTGGDDGFGHIEFVVISKRRERTVKKAFGRDGFKLYDKRSIDGDCALFPFDQRLNPEGP